MFGISHSVPILSAADVRNNIKHGFTAGTYIGLGGATARIINTRLSRVHAVWITKNQHGYVAATTNGLMYGANAVMAAGTPSSFYLVASAAPSGASFLPTVGLAAAATFKWLALGERGG